MGNCKSIVNSACNNTQAPVDPESCGPTREELFEEVDKITQEFVKDYCSVGPHEVCDNPVVLVAAYNEYVETKLRQINAKLGNRYFEYFNDSTSILLHLVNSLPEADIKFILVIHNMFPPRVLHRLMGHRLVYSHHINTIKGVAGIRLHRFPCNLDQKSPSAT